MPELGADVLLCSPYKFYGPHLGLAFGAARAARVVAAVQGAAPPTFPVGHRYETGTLAHELLAGFVAAVEYLEASAGSSSSSTSASSASGSSTACPDGWTLHGLADDGGPRADVRDHARRRRPEGGRDRLGERGFAVWHGNYYAVEVMKRLGLDEGAVRVGIVHYNTEDEVDRLLDELPSEWSSTTS